MNDEHGGEQLLTFTLLTFIGIGLLIVLIALIRRTGRRKPTSKQTAVTRSVVYLVSGSHLLVMQQVRNGCLRTRIEVPKGKIKADETAISAAYRECSEESGLHPNDLQLLTMFSTDRRIGKRDVVENWAAYWGTVPAGTTTPFTHKVRGKGGDRGRVYQYQLVPLVTAHLHSPLDRPLSILQRVLSENGDSSIASGIR
jgi:8-oxo-dGTP pyrophosphatase MutT (NUDIX family)